jgi:hypothetical protein
MASQRPSVQKRARERKLAEKAAAKREDRTRRESNRGAGEGAQVATAEDLEGYGVAPPPTGPSRGDAH